MSDEVQLMAAGGTVLVGFCVWLAAKVRSDKRERMRQLLTNGIVGQCLRVRTDITVVVAEDVASAVAWTAKKQQTGEYDYYAYEWKYRYWWEKSKTSLHAGDSYLLFADSTLTVLRSDGKAALCRIARSEGDAKRHGWLLPHRVLVWASAVELVANCKQVAAVGDEVVLQEVKVDEDVSRRMREDGVA